MYNSRKFNGRYPKYPAQYRRRQYHVSGLDVWTVIVFVLAIATIAILGFGGAL